MTKPRTIAITAQDLERLEFTARLGDDGAFEAFGLRHEKWPGRIAVSGVVFRLEETDIRDEEQMTLAWYVPER